MWSTETSGAGGCKGTCCFLAASDILGSGRPGEGRWWKGVALDIVNSPDIRLDREIGSTSFTPSQWTLEEAEWPPLNYQWPPLIHHGPTQSTFLILLDDPMENAMFFDPKTAVAASSKLSLSKDFASRLVHIGDGYPLPEDEEMVSLARAAIVAFLVHVGAWPWPCRY
jgi:hypothetical protein